MKRIGSNPFFSWSTLEVLYSVADLKGCRLEMGRVITKCPTNARLLNSSVCGVLYREEQFVDIMAEKEDVAIKRTQCQNAVKALREALTALDALPTSLMQRLQGAQSGDGTSVTSRAPPAAPSHASSSSRMLANNYDAALMSVSPPYARSRRGPYNPRAMSQAAKMASDAMSGVSSQEEADMRRAESLANPFGYE